MRWFYFLLCPPTYSPCGMNNMKQIAPPAISSAFNSPCPIDWWILVCNQRQLPSLLKVSLLLLRADGVGREIPIRRIRRSKPRLQRGPPPFVIAPIVLTLFWMTRPWPVLYSRRSRRRKWIFYSPSSPRKLTGPAERTMSVKLAHSRRRSFYLFPILAVDQSCCRMHKRDGSGLFYSADSTLILVFSLHSTFSFVLGRIFRVSL